MDEEMSYSSLRRQTSQFFSEHGTSTLWTIIPINNYNNQYFPRDDGFEFSSWNFNEGYANGRISKAEVKKMIS